MNYAVLILAFVFLFLFATVLWFAWGRKVYAGPITKVLGVEIFVEGQFRQVGSVRPVQRLGKPAFALESVDRGIKICNRKNGIRELGEKSPMIIIFFYPLHYTPKSKPTPNLNP